ncbi:retinoblastoma-like protein 1 [Tubulanus polymorphus]|uniref:retinoblastoma-like protein 1 n=1 Tax=Tubulanus polymorphus TaxID=672921 RepID=UPI003DA6139B
MGLSDDDDTQHRYDELCMDLNMDQTAKQEAIQSFETISINYTLEGDSIHWLACALYVSCRKSLVPTVGKGSLMEGNFVSLTRLLRSAKLSLNQFFSKMEKWADMANLPQEFRDKVDRLQRVYAVANVIFKKFSPIFLDIFKDPMEEPPKPTRGRKQRRLPCSVSEVFTFCWTMFAQVKGNFPAISDDLVNSYHLLLCCVDWMFANAVMSNRRDLLNPKFRGLVNYGIDHTVAEPPCILHILCEEHDGLVVEALGIKEHWFRPYLKKLFEKKTLRGKAENFSGVIEVGNYEANSKSINLQYEEYVLTVGDFDERIFLGDDAAIELGTPAKSQNSGDIRRSIQHHMDTQTKSLTPSTPLTGRCYLKSKEQHVTPVSTATQSVSKLQALLSGRKTSPSDCLLLIFKECAESPNDVIVKRVKDMGEIFCTSYAQPYNDHPGSQIDFAKKRLQLGESLYYKILENVIMHERKIMASKDKSALSSIFENEVFHKCLFACCLEVVIYSYNSQRSFPWIVDIFELSTYDFYKVIELLIRAEEGLSRDVVKHLNHIEETILESLAWRYESPLWDAIHAAKNVPFCEDCHWPQQIEKDNAHITATNTSPILPAVRRVFDRTQSPLAAKEVTLSPGPSAMDRFSSPMAGSIKRRLFTTAATTTSAPNSSVTTAITATNGTAAAAGTTAAAPAGASAGNAPNSPQIVKTVQQQQVVTYQAKLQDGRQVFIPVTMLPSGALSSPIRISRVAAPKPPVVKPKKTGSLALFFRKFYTLASVRLRDMCERIEIDADLRRRIWTCFEWTIVNETELLMDRHLDQIIMCAIYVMSKVSDADKSFQDIMKYYRMQPQAQSHVYRSVLLTSRKRHVSGASSASGSSSPFPEDKDEKEKKRAEHLSSIRSTSTLPVPNPNSQPPTPTRLSGTGTTFEFEDRGDLIKFYNSVFVSKLRHFAMKFSASSQGKSPLLSPLPRVQSHKMSPRKVSSNHSVFVSPHKSKTPLTPNSRMLYCFNRSPAKDLRAINTMIKMGERRVTVKRIFSRDHDESLQPPQKRFTTETQPLFSRRLVNLTADRLNNKQT